MPAKAHYAKLTDEELEAANQALQAEHAALSDEQDKIAAERDERFQKAKAAALLEGLTVGERDVLIEAAAAQANADAKDPGA